MSRYSEQDLLLMRENVVRNCLKSMEGNVVIGPQSKPLPTVTTTASTVSSFKPFTLALVGQMISGKNRVLVRRDGMHIPKKQFINWRTDRHFQILEQRPALPPAITIPVKLLCQYFPGDHRTRDVDGMLSALFHLLVYAKVLKDDGLIYDVEWYRYPHAKFPKVLMDIVPWESSEVQP